MIDVTSMVRERTICYVDTRPLVRLVAIDEQHNNLAFQTVRQRTTQ